MCTGRVDTVLVNATSALSRETSSGPRPVHMGSNFLRILKNSVFSLGPEVRKFSELEKNPNFFPKVRLLPSGYQLLRIKNSQKVHRNR